MVLVRGPHYNNSLRLFGWNEQIFLLLVGGLNLSKETHFLGRIDLGSISWWMNLNFPISSITDKISPLQVEKEKLLLMLINKQKSWWINPRKKKWALDEFRTFNIRGLPHARAKGSCRWAKALHSYKIEVGFNACKNLQVWHIYFLKSYGKEQFLKTKRLKTHLKTNLSQRR